MSRLKHRLYPLVIAVIGVIAAAGGQLRTR
jgi:hypothetical protein